MTVDCSSEAMEARGSMQKFSSAQRKELSSQIKNTAEMSFRNEEEIKTFSGEGEN